MFVHGLHFLHGDGYADRSSVMSSLCRGCGGAMQKNRKGHEQICPKCSEEVKFNKIHVAEDKLDKLIQKRRNKK